MKSKILLNVNKICENIIIDLCENYVYFILIDCIFLLFFFFKKNRSNNGVLWEIVIEKCLN